MSRRRVTQARLHDIKLVVGGVSMPTEYPAQNKTIPDLEMWYDGTVLEINAFKKCFGIPLANVQYILFAPEEKKLTGEKPTISGRA
jgi:hypothetical protein